MDELRLNVAQHQRLESVTTTKLLPSGLDLTRIAAAFDLCVDTEETELFPHQRAGTPIADAYPNIATSTWEPSLNVEVIEAIPSSTKKKMLDRPAWIFDLMPHLKCHRFEGKALDDAVVHMLQQRVRTCSSELLLLRCCPTASVILSMVAFITLFDRT